MGDFTKNISELNFSNSDYLIVSLKFENISDEKNRKLDQHLSGVIKFIGSFSTQEELEENLTLYRNFFPDVKFFVLNTKDMINFNVSSSGEISSIESNSFQETSKSEEKISTEETVEPKTSVKKSKNRKSIVIEEESEKSESEKSEMEDPEPVPIEHKISKKKEIEIPIKTAVKNNGKRNNRKKK